MERWLPVVGYEGLYEVSDLGRVRSIAAGRVIDARAKPSVQPKPHPHMAVPLYKGNVRKWMYVHRLVLSAFVRPGKKQEQGCHNNGKSWDNRLENLRWGSAKSNAADKKLHGTDNSGERQGSSKLLSGDIDRIFDMRAAGCTHRQIAEWLGSVQRRNIGRVLDRTRWQHMSNQNV